MKTLPGLILAMLLAGCHPDASPSGNPGTQANAIAIIYSTNDGSTIEQAVMITGATNEDAGVAAEYAWLKQKHPRYIINKQALINSSNRQYDLIEITTTNGPKSIYFDITEFFGK